MCLGCAHLTVLTWLADACKKTGSVWWHRARTRLHSSCLTAGESAHLYSVTTLHASYSVLRSLWAASLPLAQFCCQEGGTKQIPGRGGLWRAQDQPCPCGLQRSSRLARARRQERGREHGRSGLSCQTVPWGLLRARHAVPSFNAGTFVVKRLGFSPNRSRRESW